jgi:hypothetical protein
MSVGDTFASRGARGYLMRAGLAWVLVTPAVAAAKIWWSGAAAAAVGVLCVAVYIVVVERYVRRHGAPPTR